MEIRRLKAQEFEQAITLSNQTFREVDHISMGTAFPQVFSKELNQSFGAFDGARLVSFIGLVPLKLRVGSAQLNTFLIGSVCTHPDYRKRGISTAILKEIYAYIDLAQASLLFVSGNRSLYTRNECYSFGKVYSYHIDKVSSKHLYEGIVREGATTDVFQVADLVEAKDVGFISSLWEWSKLLDAGGYTSIFKMNQALYVAENNGKVDGYVVVGIPTKNSRKKQALVTDWGGGPTAINGILMDLLEKNVVTEFKITVPWQDLIHDKLSDLPYETKQNGGTVHIVNAERLLEQLRPYLREKDSKLAKSMTIYETTDRNIIMQYNETKLTWTKEELVNMMFQFQDDPKLSELQKVFPVPLPSTEGMHYV